MPGGLKDEKKYLEIMVCARFGQLTNTPTGKIEPVSDSEAVRLEGLLVYEEPVHSPVSTP